MAHPAVNQTFTVFATVENSSPYSASNVNIKFYNDSVYIGSTTLPFIGPNSNVTVSKNFAFNPDGFYPIKVWIDSAGVLGETNRLNNYAIRPIIVGNFTVPGTINVSTIAYPQSCPIGAATISGYANYSGLNLQGTPPVLGATVTVIIGNDTLHTYTATDGSWSVFYTKNGNGVPCSVGQSYIVYVTDYTLTGNTVVHSFTVPCVNCNPTGGGFGGGGVSYSPSYYPSSSAPSCLVNAQSFNYSIPIYNSGNASSYFDTTRVYADGISGYTHVKDSIVAGQTVSYNDAFSLSSGIHTLSFVHTYKNKTGANFSSTSSTTVYVQPNLPDFYLANYSQTGSTSFVVGNYDGSCVSAPASIVYVFDSMSFYPNKVLIDSITVVAIAAGGGVSLNYNKPTLAQGFHYLTLVTDGGHRISELNETNNTLNAVLYVPLPELYISYVSASLTNAVVGNQMNFLASVHNSGANCSSFKVQFKIGNTPIGNKIIVGSGLNTGDSALVVSDAFTIPSSSFACPYLIYATVDADNQVTELNEFNNTDSSFYFGTDLTSGYNCNYYYAPIGSSCNPYTTPVGGTLNMQSVISNIATRDADTVHVKFSIGGSTIGYDNITHIAANSSQYTFITHQFNTVGSYAIKMEPDYDSKYCEESEYNDVGYIYVNVTAGAPDLEVLSQYISPSNLNPNPNQIISKK